MFLCSPTIKWRSISYHHLLRWVLKISKCLCSMQTSLWSFLYDMEDPRDPQLKCGNLSFWLLAWIENLQKHINLPKIEKLAELTIELKNGCIIAHFGFLQCFIVSVYVHNTYWNLIQIDFHLSSQFKTTWMHGHLRNQLMHEMSLIITTSSKIQWVITITFTYIILTNYDFICFIPKKRVMCHLHYIASAVSNYFGDVFMHTSLLPLWHNGHSSSIGTLKKFFFYMLLFRWSWQLHEML